MTYFQYMCKCAQTYKYVISNKMNLFYTAVLPTLYAHYTGGEAKTDAEYPFPAKVNEVPDFTRCVDTNDRMKKSWAQEQTKEERKCHRKHERCAHQCVLHTSLVALCQLYKQIWMHNPNAVLYEMFDWFAKK